MIKSSTFVSVFPAQRCRTRNATDLTISRDTTNPSDTAAGVKSFSIIGFMVKPHGCRIDRASPDTAGY
jgi:hypothetical protein